MMSARKLLIICSVVILILLAITIKVNAISPEIKNGTLDLSNYNFEDDGNVKLSGKWKYFNGCFLTQEEAQSCSAFGFVEVPKDLKGQICANDTLGRFGFGTYSLKIIINKNDINKSFSLKTLGIISASKIFMNNQLVGYGGTIAESEQNAVPELQTHLNEFIPYTDTLYFTIQTSNYLIHSAGLYFSIEMGLEKVITQHRIVDVGLSLFIIGGIIFMMIYHLALYIIRKEEKLTLYFALSSLVIAIYSFSFNELYYTFFSAFSFEFQLCLKRIALYLTITFTALFIYHSFKSKFNKNILKLIITISLLFVIGTIILPIKSSTYFLKTFHYIALVSSIYYVLVIIRAYRDKQEGALILMIGMFIGFASIVHDVLNNRQLINSVNLAPFAFFFICFTQAVFLSMKFNTLFRKNEQLLLDKTSLSIQNNEKDALIQEVHKLSSFKEDLTNMIVHDLKSPLSSIVNLRLIKDDTTRIKMVEQSGYRMLNLVQNILDVYKYENTQLKLEKKEFSISELIDSAYGEVKFHGESKLLVFNNKVGSEFNCYADENIIRRVLVNLFSNAVKFSPTGGNITISQVQLENEKLRIRIFNQGPAIPYNKQGLLFKRFGQAEVRQEKGANSTGLGLAFCKIAMDAHNEEIGVNSEVNSEVEFWFTLPYKKQESKKNTQLQSANNKNELIKSTLFNELLALETFEISKIDEKVNELVNTNKIPSDIGNAILELAYSGDKNLYGQFIKKFLYYD